MVEHRQLVGDQPQAEHGAANELAGSCHRALPNQPGGGARARNTHASTTAPTTDGPSGRGAHRGAPSPRASSAAPGARLCAGSARSRSRQGPSRTGLNSSPTARSVMGGSRRRRRSSKERRRAAPPASRRDQPGVLHVEAVCCRPGEIACGCIENTIPSSSTFSNPSPIFGNSIMVMPIEWPVTCPSAAPRSWNPLATAR